MPCSATGVQHERELFKRNSHEWNPLKGSPLVAARISKSAVLLAGTRESWLLVFLGSVFPFVVFLFSGDRIWEGEDLNNGPLHCYYFGEALSVYSQSLGSMARSQEVNLFFFTEVEQALLHNCR
jgi:hypothetical protein